MEDATCTEENMTRMRNVGGEIASAIDERDNGNYLTEEYDNKEEAIREADIEWDKYKTDEPKRQPYFAVERSNVYDVK